jgi:hypothetical protein
MFSITTGTSLLEKFNPLQYISQEEYVHLWSKAYNLVLSGFWGKLMAAFCLFGAFWFGVYRKMPGLGIVLFFITVIITYLGGVVKAAFWWAN